MRAIGLAGVRRELAFAAAAKFQTAGGNLRSHPPAYKALNESVTGKRKLQMSYEENLQHYMDQTPQDFKPGEFPEMVFRKWSEIRGAFDQTIGNDLFGQRRARASARKLPFRVLVVLRR